MPELMGASRFGTQPGTTDVIRIQSAGIWKSRTEAYQFSPDALANGLADGSRILCQGLIKDWVEWWLIGQAPLASQLPHAFDYLRNGPGITS